MKAKLIKENVEFTGVDLNDLTDQIKLAGYKNLVFQLPLDDPDLTKVDPGTLVKITNT